MTDGDEREPLWASSQPRPPQPGWDEVFAEPVEAEDVPRQPPEPALVVLRRIAVGMGVVALFAVMAAALVSKGSVQFEEVPSFWGSVPLTCETMRLENDEHALELFKCEALSGGFLPPGVYDSPESQWTSDLTGIDALANGLEISSDGKLTGWAIY